METTTTAALVSSRLNTIRAQFDDPSWLPTLVRLLAWEGPVTADRVAVEGGWRIEQVTQWLAAHASVEWDAQRRVIGFGLTLRPTSHKFTFRGGEVFGWCASDALAFPVLLGEAGTVESTCPVTGRLITVEVAPTGVARVDPPAAVVSGLRSAQRVDDVRADICSLGLFFDSRDTAAPWLGRNPGGYVVSVTDDFDVHRRVMIELGWAAGR